MRIIRNNIKFFLLLISILLFISCDGRINVRIYTYENNSIEGVFYQDTLLDGKPVSNTFITIYLANRDSSFYSSSSYNIRMKTDSTGKVERSFTIPPMHKERTFTGFIIAQKDGYSIDTLKFRHSSVDCVMCIINMKKQKTTNRLLLKNTN